MTDKLMMRSFLCNVELIARSFLAEPSQNILAKMNKVLLCSVEEKFDQGVLDELRAFLSKLEVGECDLNALFYFLAQSLLISFSHRKPNMDELDTSITPQSRRVVELEVEEIKLVALIDKNVRIEMPVEHDAAELSIDRGQTPKNEPPDDEEFKTSKAMESAEEFDEDVLDETASPKHEAQEYDFEEAMDDEEEEEEEKSPANAGDSTTITCPFCPAKCAADNLTSIQNHIFKNHKFKGSLFKCLKCNIALNSAQHLKGCTGPMIFHYDPAQKPRFGRKSSIMPGRTCPICKEQFKKCTKNGITLFLLSKHFQAKHKDTPGTFFRCSKCVDIRMRGRNHFNKHLEKAACGGEVEFFHCTGKP